MNSSNLGPPRPFENRISVLVHGEVLAGPMQDEKFRFSGAGNRAPTLAVWITAHILDQGEEYPNELLRQYNFFVEQRLNLEPIMYQTVSRYINLLEDDELNVLTVSKVEEPGQHKFPRTYYAVTDNFRDQYGTEWIDRQPESDNTFKELLEPIPDVLLDPWRGEA